MGFCHMRLIGEVPSIAGWKLILARLLSPRAPDKSAGPAPILITQELGHRAPPATAARSRSPPQPSRSPSRHPRRPFDMPHPSVGWQIFLPPARSTDGQDVLAGPGSPRPWPSVRSRAIAADPRANRNTAFLPRRALLTANCLS